MRVIKTLEDLRLLMEAEALPKVYLRHIEQYFRGLMETLREYGTQPDGEFSMERYNIFVILEAGDNVRNLECAGLNRKDGGLMGAPVEFVNTVPLDGMTAYQIGVLYDNEFMGIFYSLKGIHDREFEAFLAEYATEGMPETGKEI